MKHENIDAVFDALRPYPQGTTAKVVAARLGWKATTASQRLGRLATYGMIDRVPAPGRTCNLFRYSLKQEVLSA